MVHISYYDSRSISIPYFAPKSFTIDGRILAISSKSPNAPLFYQNVRYLTVGKLISPIEYLFESVEKLTLQMESSISSFEISIESSVQFVACAVRRIITLSPRSWWLLLATNFPRNEIYEHHKLQRRCILIAPKVKYIFNLICDMTHRFHIV